MLLHGLLAAALALDGRALSIGKPIGSGSFGSVHWAQYGGQLCVAKRSNGERGAAVYLETEEAICRLLAARGGDSPHLARLVGSCVRDGQRCVVWRACGEHTLEDSMNAGASGLRELVTCLLGSGDDRAGSLAAAPSPAVSRSLLRSLLEAISHIHALGIVHRDVKPANVLMSHVAGELVLIDFGSACDLASWSHRRGYSPTRIPCAILYCPPEQRLLLAHPFAYDVYSAAVVWLRACVPSLAASEDALYSLRLQLRDHRHCPAAWLAAARAGTTGTSLPPDWDESVFGGATSGGSNQAWELLCAMLALDPAARPDAATVLVGPYLNHDCATAQTVPLPAPKPWTYEALVRAVGAGHGFAVPEECFLREHTEPAAVRNRGG